MLLPGLARADQESKDANKSKTPTEGTKPAHKELKADSRETEKTEKVVITGSLIPRTMRRSGNITDTPSSVYVIDRKQLERSGAASVTQALRMTGFNR
jgi:outer membrane receptor for Fe3+-dicitrate